MVTMADTPRMAMRIDITTKVYGRLRASLTIHMRSQNFQSAAHDGAQVGRYTYYFKRFRPIEKPPRGVLGIALLSYRGGCAARLGSGSDSLQRVRVLVAAGLPTKLRLDKKEES